MSFTIEVGQVWLEHSSLGARHAHRGVMDLVLILAHDRDCPLGRDSDVMIRMWKVLMTSKEGKTKVENHWYPMASDTLAFATKMDIR